MLLLVSLTKSSINFKTGSKITCGFSLKDQPSIRSSHFSASNVILGRVLEPCEIVVIIAIRIVSYCVKASKRFQIHTEFLYLWKLSEYEKFTSTSGVRAALFNCSIGIESARDA